MGIIAASNGESQLPARQPRLDDAGDQAMKPERYGPFPYTPIHQRPKLAWPGGARVALWGVPNIEFFPLDEPIPGLRSVECLCAAASPAHWPSAHCCSRLTTLPCGVSLLPALSSASTDENNTLTVR